MDFANHTPRVSWRPEARIKDLKDREKRFMALGENGSWISVSNKAGLVWSGIPEQYPHGCLRKLDWMEKDSPGKISLISLGTNGEYFIKSHKMAAWRLPTQMIHHVDMERNWPTVTVCALGRCGSYIVRWKNEMAWYLKEHYYILNHIVRGRAREVPIRVGLVQYCTIPFQGIADAFCSVGRSFGFTRRWFLRNI